MAPTKRKGDSDSRAEQTGARKKVKILVNAKSKDRNPSRVSTVPKSASGRTKRSSSDDAPPPSLPLHSSVLKEDEPSFPRGGGSALTLLEKRQIQAQANRDVLFEQQSLGDGADGLDSDSENLDEGNKKSKPAQKAKKAQNLRKKPTAPSGELAAVKVEGLNFKRVVAGSMILGQVSSIRSHEITVALPNNLTGYIALTAISDMFTEKIEKVLNEQGEGPNDASSSTSEDDIDLESYFSVGQFLRTYVISTSEESTNISAGPRKRIELSINPHFANEGLEKSSLIVSSMIQASVSSIEDHGLIMDLGMPGMKGFVPSNALGDNLTITGTKTGSVFLCMVTHRATGGAVVQLSADLRKAGHVKKANYLSTGPTIDPFLPGVAAEIQLSEVTPSGLVGKIMGMLDVTADLFHSAAHGFQTELTEKYQPGQKIKGRIICTFPTSSSKKLGFSLLDHVVSLSPLPFLGIPGAEPLPEMPSVSNIIPTAKVTRVEANVGLFLEIGPELPQGFVHISRVSDGKVEPLSASTGAYKVGSEHEARIIGQNAMDGLFVLSMERKVIAQPFLRLEEVRLGEVLKGIVEKLLIGPNGVSGIIVKIADHISGLVPEMHIADAQLKHPEKKFREGMIVKVRVLTTNPEKNQLRFTLKKSLVNSEADVWSSYMDIIPGAKSQGTLISVKPRGAVVQFYGSVKGFLPVSEMSEAYIKDATEHFRVGQVVSVFVLTIDRELSRLTLSCKDASSFTEDRQTAFENLQPGTVVSGSVFEKSNDDILLNLDMGLVARLGLEHVGDGSLQKNSSKFRDIRVGQKLNDLLVLEKQDNRRLILVSSKPSLIKATKETVLLKSFEDVREGQKVSGFVKNTSPHGIFVGFVGRLTGLIMKSQITEDLVKLPNFGVRHSQSISARVHLVDPSQQRFYLTMKAPKKLEVSPQQSRLGGKAESALLEDPVDGITTSLKDFTLGKLSQARITSVKQTQINVVLAKNVQGRIHVSEVFDVWEDIKDKKRPLDDFEHGQVIDVRVLGIHDAHNHRFLPLSSKIGKNPVFELSARQSMIKFPGNEVLTRDRVEVGSSWTCFVNNVEADCIWVNLSPLVRGLIRAFDVSQDLSELSNLEKAFPVGSALRATVTNVKVDTNYLTLSAKGEGSTGPLQLAELTQGTILPGKVTKIMEKQILVQLSETIVGSVQLHDMVDNFEEANPAAYDKNEIIRVSVVQVDLPNKRVLLSTRPSKILSSSLEIKDPEILSLDQLQPNAIVRGFISHVADHGLFITLGHKVTGYVRVTNLSDSYLKDWKDSFQVNQLIQGKILAVEKERKWVQMSLKASVMDPNYTPPMTFNDLKIGQFVTGKVAKVEDFGVFIVVDGSANVRGLCHRSEMADQKVEDARKLYGEGDSVKAKILKLDAEKRRVNFGLKASYFQQDLDMDSSSDAEDEGAADETASLKVASDGNNGEDDDSNEDDDLAGGVGIEPSDESNGSSDDDEMKIDQPSSTKTTKGLSVGFNWAGEAGHDASDVSEPSSNGDRPITPTKRKRKKAEIQVDKTGELDAQGPQSAADFERLLLGEPDSSFLWVSYMAFQLELSEVDKARSVAERSLRTIGISQEADKMNVWVALLNLENTYGSDESLEETFQRACQYNDVQEIHEKFASILIGSGKIEKADSVLQALTKRFSRDPKVWTNYVHFLFNTTFAPDRGRALLPRAMQSLPSHTHVDLTSKFGQLEFSSENGDPERGRTIFEGLLSSFPKRVDLWSVLIDCEVKHGDSEAARSVFERLTMGEKLRAKQAKFFFKKWLAFEEGVGDERMIEEVKSKAAEFVRAQKRQGD